MKLNVQAYNYGYQTMQVTDFQVGQDGTSPMLKSMNLAQNSKDCSVCCSGKVVYL